MASQSRLPDSSIEPTESPKPAALESARYVLEELKPDSPSHVLHAARELLLEYGRFVTAAPGNARFCFGTLEQEAAGLPQSYLNQGGGVVVASLGQRAAGFVAWRSLRVLGLEAAWELKRLWVRPEARGSGIGRAMVQAVIDRAWAANKTSMLLDTMPDAMAAAYGIYRQMGFVECSAYNGPSAEGIVYMRKALKSP